MTKEQHQKANAILEEIDTLDSLKTHLSDGLKSDMYFDSLKIHLYRAGGGIDISSQIKDRDLSKKILAFMGKEIYEHIKSLQKEYEDL